MPWYENIGRSHYELARASGSINVGFESIVTKTEHSSHFRLSLNSGSTEDIAVGPVVPNPEVKRLAVHHPRSYRFRTSGAPLAAITSHSHARDNIQGRRRMRGE
jgi:hypothetical protein